MSLESKIEALTLAVEALTAAIKAEAGNYDMPAVDFPPEEPVQAEPRKARKPKAPEYADVAKKFLEYIAANGRDAALKVLEPWDATSLKDVPAEDLGKVLEKISG